MTTITLDKAQQDLPDLIKRALAGEEIVIAAEDKLVRLTPTAFDEITARKRGWGAYKGRFEVPDSFFEALSDEECGLGPDTDTETADKEGM